jgi:hypothetical protein
LILFIPGPGSSFLLAWFWDFGKKVYGRKSQEEGLGDGILP